MRAAIDKRRVDEAMNACLDWRELSRAVQQAHDRWTHAPRSEAGAASLECTITLEREKRSALAYAVLTGSVIR